MEPEEASEETECRGNNKGSQDLRSAHPDIISWDIIPTTLVTIQIHLAKCIFFSFLHIFSLRTYLLLQATLKSLETALLRLDKTAIGELKSSKDKTNAFNVLIIGLLCHR